jgi:hypothetical protein
LLGTDVVGDPNNHSAQWSVAFSTDTYDKFLFASGDFTIWAQALVIEVGPGVKYSNTSNDYQERNVINSSSSSTAYKSDWHNNGSPY